MEYLLPFLGGMILWALLEWGRRRSAAAAGRRPRGSAPTAAAETQGLAAVYRCADQLADFFTSSAQPGDLIEHSAFQRGVDMLLADEFQARDLLGYYSGDNAIIACMAMEALSRRTAADEDLFEPIVAAINTVALWSRFYALRALEVHGRPPLVGRLLLRADASWDNRMSLRFLSDFVAGRVRRGETPSFGAGLSGINEERAAFLERLAGTLDAGLRGTLSQELSAWRAGRVDTDLLASIGRVWSDDQDSAGIVATSRLNERVAVLAQALRGQRPRSVLVVGQKGVGKTSVLKALAADLRRQGWVTFEASAAEVLAGQKYVGELEGRVQQLVRCMSGARRVLWVVPGFHELLWAGRHRFSPIGLLDLLLPAIEKGEIVVAGETDPAAYERLLLAQPRLRGILEAVVFEPLPEGETLDLARRWLAARGGEAAPAAILRETLELARQYLGEHGAPGNLLELLELTLAARRAPGARAAGALSTEELLATISRLTGLPLAMLDEQQVLDLTGLRGFFERRVLGQTEAIDCLVERVALVKAGLTDPARPAGVFFFTGPTGTGKTALAKALAEYLFGSADRLLRLDMSEFQTADSLGRILGEGDEFSNRSALADRVRQQPFSVLLLDEFEKAHPAVWDVFLQLFDDGRLTDRMGRVADFRHTIVIMTSNFGGDLSKAGSIGFSGDRTSEVRRSLEREFRKEFLNRIDRVVVFQPLRRSVMRDILHQELDLVLSRRGLRNRAWAVEWEESAIEFLLDKGFTTDLGARPLKRAIERYLLAPLALTIVDHRLPEGDQFLFVRSDGQRIDVVFVDPDAPAEPEPAVAEVPAEGEAIRLERVILDARGEPRERAFLEQEVRRLAGGLSAGPWRERKEAALGAMAQPSFWQSAERFVTLGLAEYMDRIEAGMKTATSLLSRLTRADGQRAQVSPSILRRLAQQVYLLDAALRGLDADQPADAFLLIESGRDAAGSTAASSAAGSDLFASRVANMYREWARKRGMRLETLEEPPAGGGYRLLLAVSGFAAFPILRQEHGLHVLEVPDANRGLVRHKARVRVHPQPAEPARKPEDALAQARAALAAEPDPVEIVRRYREEPSPLCRDAVRNWRTGRVDLVLAGDFDLML